MRSRHRMLAIAAAVLVAGGGATARAQEGDPPTADVPVELTTPVLVAPRDGAVFPVAGDRADFSDTYGAPRAGTGWHQGADIFAPAGTPVLAVADGVLYSVGVNTLGGNRLWIRDGGGTTYYYAHLSGYAPGVADGVRVRAGQVVGFLGNTGQARTTPPHLHFEIHPGDGPSINPTEYLRAWSSPAGAEPAPAAEPERRPQSLGAVLVFAASPAAPGGGEGAGAAVAVG